MRGGFMVNEHEPPPYRRLVAKGQYALITLLIIVAGIAGLIAGRSLGQISNRVSQLPSGNEITLPRGGLLFKSKEGKLVAKLDTDEVGASLILYNGKEQATIL